MVDQLRQDCSHDEQDLKIISSLDNLLVKIKRRNFNSKLYEKQRDSPLETDHEEQA